MPLNPNGKVDKPALPFPDTAEAASASNDAKPSVEAAEATPTEKLVQSIWSNLLPNAPKPIPLDESFFDLGSHSVLATRLIFDLRRTAGVGSAPLSLVFDQPTARVHAAALDALRGADLSLGLANGKDGSQSPTVPSVPPEADYARDINSLLPYLKE